MTNGLIDLDTPFAQLIGFTSDKFLGYLWKDSDGCAGMLYDHAPQTRSDLRVMLSAVMSRQPGQGNFSRLLAAIEGQGLKVAVPTPLPKMRVILTKKGFTPHVEVDPIAGEVEVWHSRDRS